MFKKITAAILSAALIIPVFDYTYSTNPVFSVSSVSVEEEPDAEIATYTVTFLDFNGNILDTLEVEEGEIIDYSLIDTSVLNGNIDKFTERRFSSWDIIPETASNNLTIQALYEEAKIELVSMPDRINYYDKMGKIKLDGLKITITITTQTTEFDENGDRIISKNVIDIAESCSTSPANLEEAFAQQNYASVSIYPIRSNLPIAEYTIIYHEGLGDINEDGIITASDGSSALSYFAATSVEAETDLTDAQIDNCDVNRDGIVTAVDAANILNYYAMSATDSQPLWENYIVS